MSDARTTAATEEFWRDALAAHASNADSEITGTSIDSGLADFAAAHLEVSEVARGPVEATETQTRPTDRGPGQPTLRTSTVSTTVNLTVSREMTRHGAGERTCVVTTAPCRSRAACDARGRRKLGGLEKLETTVAGQPGGICSTACRSSTVMRVELADDLEVLVEHFLASRCPRRASQIGSERT